MARYFNGKEVELLAPAGTFEIFKAVIESKCDAVYFGGPVLNMRMMRKGYNLSHEEIIEALNIAHSMDKKYISRSTICSAKRMWKRPERTLASWTRSARTR